MPVVTRFAFTLEHDGGKCAPLVLPLRGDPSCNTVGDLIRSLERRLDRKYSPQKAPPVRQLLLSDGDALDPLLNDEDSLDCFWGGAETHHVTVCLGSPAAATAAADGLPVKTAAGSPTPFLPSIPSSARPGVLSTPTSPASVPSSPALRTKGSADAPNPTRVRAKAQRPAGDADSGGSTGSPAPSSAKARRWRELSNEKAAASPGSATRAVGPNHGHQGLAAVPPQGDRDAAARAPRRPPPPAGSVKPATQRSIPVGLCGGWDTPGVPVPPSRSPKPLTPQAPPSLTGGCLSRRLPSQGGSGVGSAAACMTLPRGGGATPSSPAWSDTLSPSNSPTAEAAAAHAECAHRAEEVARWGDMLLRELLFNEERERCCTQQDEDAGRASVARARQAGVAAREDRLRRHRLELAEMLHRQWRLERSEEGDARRSAEDAQQAARTELQRAEELAAAHIRGVAGLRDAEGGAREAVELAETAARDAERQWERAAAREARDALAAAQAGAQHAALARVEVAGRIAAAADEGSARAELAASAASDAGCLREAESVRAALLAAELTARRGIAAAEAAEGAARRDACVDGALAIRLRLEAEHDARVRALGEAEGAGRGPLERTELQKRLMYSRLAAEAAQRLHGGADAAAASFPPVPMPSPSCPARGAASADPSTEAGGAPRERKLSSRLRSRGSAASDEQEVRKSVSFRLPLRDTFSPPPAGPTPIESDPVD
eukprot:TRINITY_DN9146_c0_g1_i2.p2 TRINITY_DN9146_c0_g1~~TRINITY_DN9146_c0_g1_i2.p2  ORF type:complete len:722 (+),score=165.86 TRINITY_DN9146_c0_g1_i2:65-2230(+)